MKVAKVDGILDMVENDLFLRVGRVFLPVVGRLLAAHIIMRPDEVAVDMTSMQRGMEVSITSSRAPFNHVRRSSSVVLRDHLIDGKRHRHFRILCLLLRRTRFLCTMLPLVLMLTPLMRMPFLLMSFSISLTASMTIMMLGMSMRVSVVVTAIAIPILIVHVLKKMCRRRKTVEVNQVILPEMESSAVSKSCGFPREQTYQKLVTRVRQHQ